MKADHITIKQENMIIEFLKFQIHMLLLIQSIYQIDILSLKIMILLKLKMLLLKIIIIIIEM